ncbi:MAG TPA: hypothetical protein VMH49_03495 [Thermoplasmata archaeon]|nr:hypothetical protein [Thermoplasmata archaeon]
MALSAEPSAPRPPNIPTSQLLETELVLEDREVLEPLTHRLGEIAELLDRGVLVEPSYIERGLELWRRFGTEVHAPRVTHLLALAPPPDATSSPTSSAPTHRPWRRRGAPESRDVQAEATRHEIQGMVHEQSLAGERVGELRRQLSFYSTGGYGARERLASVLHAFVVADEAWVRSEEQFVLSAFRGQLSADSDRKLRQGLAQVRGARAALLEAVTAYVAAAIPQRKSPTARV